MLTSETANSQSVQMMVVGGAGGDKDEMMGWRMEEKRVSNEPAATYTPGNMHSNTIEQTHHATCTATHTLGNMHSV